MASLCLKYFLKAITGNSVLSWLIAFSIIVGSFVLAKLVYWIFSRVLRMVTSKSKTNLDDIIVDMIEEPAVFMVIVAGIWFGLNTLTLPERFVEILGNAYQVIVALTIGWMLTRLFDALYREYLIPLTEKSDTDLDDQLAPIIGKAVKTIIWAMAIVIGLNNAGYDVAALIAGLGIGGLALAMAAQDTVSNVFGGFTIFTDKPFTIGDRIKISGFDGTVAEIGIRSTRLRTLEGRLVTIPNSTFAGSPVENVSAEPSRKVVLNLGLTYDTTPEKMQLAIDTLRQINDENSATSDSPVTGFNAFGDFAMNIIFIYYINPGEDIMGTQTQMNMAILSKFNEQGLEFAFPTQTLYNINQS